MRPLTAISFLAAALSTAGCVDTSELTVIDEGRGSGGAEARQELEEEPPETLPNPGSMTGGVPHSTRLARLTHVQYDNTASDILGFDVQLSSEFLSDISISGFSNNIEELRVAGRLGRDYRRAAEHLAARYVQERDLGEVVSCEPSESECAAEFIKKFGRRAFRRPLKKHEQEAYGALFAQGSSLAENEDPFLDGVQVVVEAMLQSPKFLYRVELTSEPQEDGFIQLDSYELATRLSYMLWNTTPDNELLGAARDGELDTREGVVAQARRLADDPRLASAVLDFHRQWLKLSEYQNLTKDPDAFPSHGPDLERAFVQETEMFIQDVVVTQGKGLASLFTAPYSFVNEDLAPLYDLSGDFGPEFEKVELDPELRGGLFTQPGFLASHAYPNDTSPIHRGVFLLRTILCRPIPDPPGDIDLTLPETNDEIITTRDQVELHTSPVGCNNCHSLINPIGFAFENFDAIGQARQEDNGAPVNTAGSVELSSGELQFEGAVDLSAQIASSSEAAFCYAQNWARYAYGRLSSVSDKEPIQSFADRLIDDDYSVGDLLVDIAQTKAFSHRPPNLQD